LRESYSARSHPISGIKAEPSIAIRAERKLPAARYAMPNGTRGQRKALLKELVAGVGVESRDSLIPIFRLQTTSVRVMESRSN